MDECIKDFFIYKYAKENPTAMAHTLSNTLGIGIYEAYDKVEKWLEEMENA